MTCRECSADKPGDDFYVDRTRPRGRVARCKVCYEAKAKSLRHTPKKRYQKSKDSAIYRNYDWRISFDEYMFWFWDAPCHFCGEAAKGGLDRFNNEPYYSMDNVIACCMRCNRMKMEMTHQEFLAHVTKVAIHTLRLETPANASVALNGLI